MKPPDKEDVRRNVADLQALSVMRSASVLPAQFPFFTFMAMYALVVQIRPTWRGQQLAMTFIFVAASCTIGRV